jgi:hypothetical protein
MPNEIRFRCNYIHVNIYFIISGGMDVVFSIFQSFFDKTALDWCFFTVEGSVYGVMLRKSSLVVYRWQGTFVPVEVSIHVCFVVHKIQCM